MSGSEPLSPNAAVSVSLLDEKRIALSFWEKFQALATIRLLVHSRCRLSGESHSLRGTTVFRNSAICRVVVVWRPEMNALRELTHEYYPSSVVGKVRRVDGFGVDKETGLHPGPEIHLLSFSGPPKKEGSSRPGVRSHNHEKTALSQTLLERPPPEIGTSKMKFRQLFWPGILHTDDLRTIMIEHRRCVPVSFS